MVTTKSGKHNVTILGFSFSAMALWAFSTFGYAGVAAVQVVVVRGGQPVPQATLNLRQAEKLVAQDETDNLGVGFMPLEEGSYALEVTASGETVTGAIEVAAQQITSFTVDLDAGSLTVNERPRDQYRPVDGVKTAGGYDVAFADLDGLLSVRILLEPGLIYLGIPARAGENRTISWSAVLLPFGETEREKTEGRNQLEQHVVRIGDSRFSLSGLTKWTMVAQHFINIELLSASRRDPVVVLTLNLNTRASGSRSVVDRGEDIVARAGWPVRIPGKFDGLADNTQVRFNGELVDVVAETSTGVYFNPPNGPFGLQPVIVVETSGAKQTSTIRNIGLELWADDLDLWKGERTPLHLRLFGLQQLSGPAYVSLINASITSVTMSRGNFQFFKIQPGDVDVSGTVEYERTLTGIQRGSFEINALMTLR